MQKSPEPLLWLLPPCLISSSQRYWSILSTGKGTNYTRELFRFGEENDYENEIFRWVLLTREPASFWWENLVFVNLLLVFSGNVVVAGTSYRQMYDACILTTFLETTVLKAHVHRTGFARLCFCFETILLSNAVFWLTSTFEERCLTILKTTARETTIIIAAFFTLDRSLERQYQRGQ